MLCFSSDVNQKGKNYLFELKKDDLKEIIRRIE